MALVPLHWVLVVAMVLTTSSKTVGERSSRPSPLPMAAQRPPRAAHWA